MIEHEVAGALRALLKGMPAFLFKLIKWGIGMRSEPIIYFTKEDGQNIVLLSTTEISASHIKLGKSEIEFCEKTLGHKLTNLYFFMNGTEFKVPSSWLQL